MANVLKSEKKAAVIGALAEGSSIRSIERQTGVHRDTIMRLGVRVGEGCKALLNEKMRGLECRRLQFDEIWGFVGKKKANVQPGETGLGDAWTFICIDATSKLVPCFRVGKRDLTTATAFVEDVASRLRNHVQISTDGLRAYVEAIERGFGGNVDYGQIVKSYASTDEGGPRRYSPPEVVSVSKDVIVGNPDNAHISTSYIESQNLTVRMHVRRLTRLTNAFSKKLENFKAAMALHFAYYNFIKIHKTLRCTPAMAAGVERSIWTVPQLVEMMA